MVSIIVRAVYGLCYIKGLIWPLFDSSWGVLKFGGLLRQLGRFDVSGLLSWKAIYRWVASMPLP